MLRQTYVSIVGILILSLVSCGRPIKTSSSKTDALPVAVPVKISREVLVSRGFSFNRQRLMCMISGPEGPCSVEAFVGEEKRVDGAAYTCSKLDRATYVGNCVNGRLDGLSLLIADGRTKGTREAFISYFHDGRMAYPALTSYLKGEKNFGVQEQESSYGCVYFGRWDKSAERCALFTEIYGADIFTEFNAQKLREGTFNLYYYRAKFLQFMRQDHTIGQLPNE